MHTARRIPNALKTLRHLGLRCSTGGGGDGHCSRRKGAASAPVCLWLTQRDVGRQLRLRWCRSVLAGLVSLAAGVGILLRHVLEVEEEEELTRPGGGGAEMCRGRSRMWWSYCASQHRTSAEPGRPSYRFRAASGEGLTPDRSVRGRMLPLARASASASFSSLADDDQPPPHP